MRPILQILPAFIWLWLVRRYGERMTFHGQTTASYANGVAVIYRENAK